MEIQQIERYVEDLLTVSGFREDGAEHHLWVLLRHLYSAVAMYEHLSDEDKAVVASTQKKLRYFFETKCNLKERKRKKTEKENTPAPPKEKENKKEKVEKTLSLAERENSDLDEEQMAFWNECKKYIGKKYSEELIQAFFYYWAQKDEKTGKMLWQIEKQKKPWELKFRLAGWSKKSFSRNDEAAAIRLEKTKAKQGGQATKGQQPKSVGVIDAHVPSDHAIAFARKEKSADTLEEYLKLHPGSPLAKYR